MKSRFISIALIISLAFNIGFIVMFVYFKCTKSKPIEGKPQVQHEQVHRQFRNEDIAEARRENSEYRRTFFQELAKPEFDEERVEELAQRLKESQKTLDQTVVKHFINLRKGMTAEEAEEFFGNMRQRRENRMNEERQEGRRRQHRERSTK